MQASRVKYIDDAIAKDPNDTDHIIEREFVDEICEVHAKPGEETPYDASHDMDLSGEKGDGAQQIIALIFSNFFNN